MKKLLLTCLLLLLSNAQPVSAQVKVECWTRHEVTIPAKVKGNPFDVEVKALFKGPDTTLVVNGFYDGNDTFKLRFMPMKQGKWSYETQSGIAALNGVKGSIECTSPAKGNHGTVVADALHLKYADGTRYYPIGTTSYDWMYAPDSVQRQTIQSLADAKFNKIRMLLFVQNFDKNYPEPASFPFKLKKTEKDKDGKLSYEWDYTQFNPAYFAHVEDCVDKLAEIGVEADIILFHPYDEGRWGFDRMPFDVNIRYLKYVTARLGAFRNVWWSMANEYDLIPNLKAEWWNQFTQTVAENNPYSHMLSIHSYTAQYQEYWKPEYTHASIQDQAPVEGHGRAATIVNIFKKPVIFDEVCYEGNMDNRWGSLSGEEMLYRMWQGTIAGAYVGHGECYMDNPTDYSHDFLAIGGKFQGECWKRIGFMRTILDALPEPLHLCDSSWDTYTSSGGDRHYMIYLGKKIMPYWEFNLPAKNMKQPRLTEGIRFKVEIIDTWNMTITEYPKIFETTAARNYRVYDKLHTRVKLPDLPYLLLRITEVK